MNHRQRAQSRIERHVPQLRSAEAGALHGRLADRQEEEERRIRPAPGDSLVLRGAADAKPRRLPAADVSESAPLLMRLVRHPYAMEPVRFGRLEYRDASHDRVRPEPLGPALAYRRELRDAYRLITPTEEFAHRPEERRPPFATARAASQEADAPVFVTGLSMPSDALVPRGVWSGAPVARTSEETP